MGLARVLGWPQTLKLMILKRLRAGLWDLSGDAVPVAHVEGVVIDTC